MLWPFRENRFRGTLLAGAPRALARALRPRLRRAEDRGRGHAQTLVSGPTGHSSRRTLSSARHEAGSTDASVNGYPVYLNGELRNSGWWYLLPLHAALQGARGNLAARRCSRWVPALRAAGRPSRGPTSLPGHRPGRRALRDELPDGHQPRASLRPVDLLLMCSSRPARSSPGWKALAASRRQFRRGRSCGVAGPDGRRGGLGSTRITWPTSTGPRAGPTATPARLIDSNLDWGQDLVGLREWCRKNLAGDERDRAGLFRADQPVDLHAAGRSVSTGSCRRSRPGRRRRCRGMRAFRLPRLVGPAPRLTPGTTPSAQRSSTGFAGGSMTLLPSCPTPGRPRGTPRTRPSRYFRHIHAHQRGSATRSTSTSSARRMSDRVNPLFQQFETLSKSPAVDQRLAANIDLRQVVFRGRAEMHAHLEARRAAGSPGKSAPNSVNTG